MNERALLREAIAWCKERHGDGIGTALSWSISQGDLVLVLQAGYKERFPVLALQHRITAKAQAVDATRQARSLALQHGVELSAVRGTGDSGRVLVDDVRRHIC